jgi:protein-tyrosine phosphatase
MTSPPKSPQSRILSFEACLNARELGGYPTRDGPQICWQKLVRSDTTFLLTLPGQQAVIDYGIRTEIDLRFPFERKNNPSPFERAFNSPLDKRPDYINIPLDEDQDLVWPSKATQAELVSDQYCRLLEKNRNHVSRVLSAFVDAQPGWVLIHCHAGKDRTGLIIALILAVAGVSNEIIARDYSYSYYLMARNRRKNLSDPTLTLDRRRYLTVLFSAKPETMLATLAYLEQRYGSVEGYLRTTSISPGDITALRQRLMEP